MRIVTWNCNGALRNKYEHLAALEADVFVVQECEEPERCRHDGYRDWSRNSIWTGSNKSRGLGVFVRPDLDLQYLSWPASTHELFLPCRVGDRLNILGVWTKQANSPNFRYIGQFWKYLQDNWRAMAKEPIVIAGDFNSNSCWDEWDRWWNHSDVVHQLASLGIESVYHHVTGEEQGGESQPTFYHHRKLEKPYHIDYVFSSIALLQRIKSFSTGSPEDWLYWSDHMPLTFEICKSDLASNTQHNDSRPSRHTSR